MIKKLFGWLRRKPAHIHDFIDFPTDMGAKVYRRCWGCDYSETVAATAAQQAATAPLANAIRAFQDQVVTDAARALKRGERP